MKSFSKKTIGLTASIAFTFAAISCGRNDHRKSTPPAAASTEVKVSSTNPSNLNIDVPINRKITASFNVPMNKATINTDTFTLFAADSSKVSGSLSFASTSNTIAVFTFTPTANLSIGTVYTASISTGAKSLDGASLASKYSWSFTTGTEADTTSPTTSTTNPAGAAINVAINRELSVSFDEPMDASTFTSSSFTVKGPSGAAVAGSISYSGTTATFHPSQSLQANTTYTVTVTKEVKDLAGNALTSVLVWTFTTGANAAKGPNAVELGTSAQYVILAKSAISTTGTTAIVGNLGLSPAAQSFMTGFSESLDSTTTFASSSVVTGQMFAADMTPPTPTKLTTAVSDMETAYTDAAGRTLPDFVELGAGDVSGKTLVPGLYKWGTGLMLTSDVTISGGENDVWIFQIAQDLTVGNGVHVTLSGGARAKNIFWQVAGQAVIGTTASFQGNILGQTQIVFKTGASITGRALAQTAVTLDANAVTKPAQ